MHTIDNDYLRISAKEFGAELTSVFYKKTNTEHLWQADEKFWGWHAPVLFPVVGRCLHDTILIDEQRYHMEKHGFARKSMFNLTEQSASQLKFMLQSSEATLAIYPYLFEFYIVYTLYENQLKVTYEVVNTGKECMYFQVGGHPALTVPFNNNEQYEDYYIEFEQPESLERHLINADGYFSGEKELVLSNESKLALRKDLFNRDALIFKNHKSRKVSIKSCNHEHYLSMTFNDFPYLGFWAKENAPYVCIEPWIGCADSTGQLKEFSEREMVNLLEPDTIFKASYSIELN